MRRTRCEHGETASVKESRGNRRRASIVLLLTFPLHWHPMPKDPYEILGVSRSASVDEIKQAYRNLSKKHHPDRRKGDATAEERYKEINQAYELLSDSKRREMYDRFGTTSSASRGSGGTGFNPQDFASAFGGMEDILETFFGRGFGGFEGFAGFTAPRGGRRARKERGEDVEIALQIPFAAVVSGSDQNVRLRKLVTCATCSGTGSKGEANLEPCPECGGEGQKVQTTRSFFGLIRQAVICDRCGGSGRTLKDPCRTCKGEGRVEEVQEVTVRIPPGIDDGQALRLRGQGHAGRRGSEAGDLFVVVSVTADPRFRREGDDVYTRLTIGPVEAVLGAEENVETIDGSVTLSVPPGTQPGQILRIRGRGLPHLNTSRRGDHYVEISLDIPTKLSRKQREIWEQLRRE